jgi:hypothetical protein
VSAHEEGIERRLEEINATLKELVAVVRACCEAEGRPSYAHRQEPEYAPSEASRREHEEEG